MTSQRPTALIADDEPLLRGVPERLLAQVWPELQVVAQSRNGREAVEKFEAMHPDVCFLDVHMPLRRRRRRPPGATASPPQGDPGDR